MDALQFGLFFTALLVGYVLVHLRLVRFEEHMQKLAGIRTIDERLRGLVETFDKLRLDRIEQHLERLHEDLEDLREATSDVRHAVVQIPAPTVQVSPAEAAPVLVPEAPAARILALVETRLLQLGYGNVRVLTELADVRLDRDAEIQVECERGIMPVKGRVVVRNGAVRDVAIQTVTSMFP